MRYSNYLVITFHVSCLKEWFNNNNTCPLCKEEY